jgi:hypothetical protein
MTNRARLLSALAAFILAAIVVTPFAFTQPLEGDEEQYIWSAAYFGGLLTSLDFRAGGTDDVTDPGWSPARWWSLTQPMGTRLFYAAVLGISSADVPRTPHFSHDPRLNTPESLVAPGTVLICRLAGVVAAAAGLALIAWRIGPRVLIAMLAFLAIPHVHVHLAYAWAEGPLLLGFGLCMLAYRTPWFAAACGLTATFKLTALGLWPLVLMPGANSSVRRWPAVTVMLLVWTALTPPSWFAYGPFYLISMILNRVDEFSQQVATLAGPDSIYFPLRYLWPIELAVLLGCLWLSRWAAQIIERRQPATSSLFWTLPKIRAKDAPGFVPGYAPGYGANEQSQKRSGPFTRLGRQAIDARCYLGSARPALAFP